MATTAEDLIVNIKTKIDDRGLAQVERALGDLEDGVTVPITAQVKGGRDIDDLMRTVDKLDRDPATLLLTSNATQITGDIADLVADMARLDADDPTIDIKATNVNDLQGDLDRVEQKLRDINDIEVAPGAKTGGAKPFADVVDGADQAKSAVANMAGNASQDIGQLVGVSGSAGVAIGQLTEYFTDTAFAAKEAGQGFGAAATSFAAAALPIAAIAAGIGIVTSLMGDQAAAADASAERTKAFGEAMASSADDASGFADVLRDNEDGLRDFAASSNDALGDFGIAVDRLGEKIPLIGGFFERTSVDVIAAMGQASLSVYDLGTALSDTQGGVASFMAKLQAAKQAGQITGEQFNAISEAVQEFNSEARKAAQTQELYNVNQREANALLQDSLDPLTKMTDQWATLTQDMADGSIDTAKAADAINQLATGLGLTREEVIKLAQGQLDQQMKDAAEATEQAAKAQQEYATVLASTDYATSQIEAAASAFGKIGAAQFGLANIAATTQAAYDSLNDSIKENGFTFDNTTEKGRANAEQIQNLYSSLIPQLSAAFADAGGSIDSFGANMDTLRTGVFQQLDQQTNLTTDQINGVINQLGVFDGSTYSSTFQMLGAEDAMTKLGLLSGVISSLPPDIQRKIALDVIAGDPYGALTEIENAVSATPIPPAVVPTEGDTSGAASDVQGFANDTQPTATVPTDANTKKAEAGIASTVDTAAKTKPIVDVNANIQAALITMAIINAVVKAMAPTVVIDADVSPAMRDIAFVSSQRPRVPVEAYLADYPSAAEIQQRIGRPRIPVDIVVGQSIRITGVRE